jgi:hypothetical protein
VRAKDSANVPQQDRGLIGGHGTPLAWASHDSFIVLREMKEGQLFLGKSRKNELLAASDETLHDPAGFLARGRMTEALLSR